MTWSAGLLPSDPPLVFWGIDGTRTPLQAGFSNVTIDDTYSHGGPVTLAYTGEWEHLSPSTNGAGDLPGNFNRTLSVTRVKGEQVTFAGQGES